MSRTTLNNRRTPVRSQTSLDPNIESLNERLMQTLNSAFDPSAAVKNDDFFLAQNYAVSAAILSDLTSENANPQKSAYEAITEKAKMHVKEAEVNGPLRTKPLSTLNKRNEGTFLTFVEAGGNANKHRMEVVQREDEYNSFEPIPSYDHMLGDITKTTGSMDDLEELRRMIKKTRKEMNDYGRELVSLKKNIQGINDYAVKELGYGVNGNLIFKMESAIDSLNDESEVKTLNKKYHASRINRLYNKGHDENTKSNIKSTSMNSTATNLLGNRKNYSSALRNATSKITFRK